MSFVLPGPVPTTLCSGSSFSVLNYYGVTSPTENPTRSNGFTALTSITSYAGYGFNSPVETSSGAYDTVTIWHYVAR